MQETEWTEARTTLVTLRDHIRWAASRFEAAGLYFGHGTDNALDEAVALVLGALCLAPDLPVAYLDARLTPHEQQHVFALLRRRIEERVPVPYLTGEAWFAGLAFAVDPRVLIPRSPFAEIIEHGFDSWVPEVAKILDLCCGSGCIGIAAACHYPQATVVLADLSAEALDVAQANIERHGVAGRVRTVRSDGFDGLAGESFDLILCNPPYVGAAERETLPAEYHHEPRLALCGGEHGLELVTRLLRDAADHLSTGGVFVLEVGNAEDALRARFPEVPFEWLELACGGGGLCLLDEAALCTHQHEFAAAADA